MAIGRQLSIFVQRTKKKTFVQFHIVLEFFIMSIGSASLVVTLDFVETSRSCILLPFSSYPEVPYSGLDVHEIAQGQNSASQP